MNNETFTCEDCGGTGHIRFLGHRVSMPGDYCLICADREKCAACGEVYPNSFVDFKSDVQNYICEDCQHDYQQVAPYIKPLQGVVTYPANKGVKAIGPLIKTKAA